MSATSTTLRSALIGLAALAVPALAHAAAAAAPAGDAAKGEALFKQRCSVCHTVVEDNVKHPGPLLKGVVGRKAGSVPGFNYSPAIKASNITWDRAGIEKFITMPSALIPGTFMVISVPNAADRQDLVAYLAKVSAGK